MKKFPLWGISVVIALVTMAVAFLIAWGAIGVRVQANEEAVKEQKAVQTEQGQAIARVDERTKMILTILIRIAEKNKND